MFDSSRRASPTAGGVGIDLIRGIGGLEEVHNLQGVIGRGHPLGRVSYAVLGGIKLSEVEQSTVLLPIGDDEQVRAALDTLWPRFRLDAVPLHGIPKRVRWFRWFD